MRNLNLIFQGGGVKGIAYAGALERLPIEYRIRGAGGTSAGAIVAALLATGRRGTGLKDVLQDKKLFSLLKQQEAERYARMKALAGKKSEFTQAIHDAKTLWSQIETRERWWQQPKNISAVNAFRRTHAALLEAAIAAWDDIEICWAAKGAHTSEDLRVWLDKLFGNTTFKDIKEAGVDLRVVAANVETKQFLIFNNSDHASERIARAVHASASVPIFFRPIESSDGQCLVDGGLLSNFPSFLFNNSPFPTVGFQLRERGVQQHPTTNALGYLVALLQTMASAHDAFRERFQQFRSYTIDTPSYIPFDKFNLAERDVNELYLEGVKISNIRWEDNEHSSEDKLIGYFDPKPHHVLHAALQQAEGIGEEHLSPRNYVDAIHETSTLQVYVHKDWTTQYHRRETITVTEGSKALFLKRVRIKVTEEVGSKLSLADVNVAWHETSNGKNEPLFYLPAFNRETEKGFLLFFSPPITTATGERSFHSSMTISKEFAQTVGRGEWDIVSLSFTRRSDRHTVTPVIQILFPASDFSDLQFRPNFKAEPTTTIKKENGVSWQSYTWTLPAQELGKITQPLIVEVNLAPS